MRHFANIYSMITNNHKGLIFTNFDKDYTFWQTLNKIKHNLYHSWDKISYLTNINNLLLNLY